MGSALSALVAYYVLFKTIENDNRENYKKYKREEYERLCNDISERIGQIEVMDTYRSFYYPENFKVKDEIDRLTCLLFSYKAKSNSFTLKYGLEKDEDFVEFYHEYNKLMIEICNSIADMIKALSKFIVLDDDNLNEEEKITLRRSLKEEISKKKDEMSRVNSMPQIVYDKAFRYCKKMKRQLDTLNI